MGEGANPGAFDEDGTDTKALYALKKKVMGAKVLVSGGRGIGRKEYFEELRKLASLLPDAEISSARTNVESGWIGRGRQVGQTGSKVKPLVYMAFGISGTPQHKAGMRHAEHILAVNKNPDAPIFELAEFGVVGDLHEIVPALIAKLSSLLN
jgi:electron transfer flavoprotein alpha subunit